MKLAGFIPCGSAELAQGVLAFTAKLEIFLVGFVGVFVCFWCWLIL